MQKKKKKKIDSIFKSILQQFKAIRETNLNQCVASVYTVCNIMMPEHIVLTPMDFI